MKWKDKELKTIGALCDAVLQIYRSGNQAEADQFMAELRASTPHANSNIGYITGYFDCDTSLGMRKMFGVVHPVFGAAYPSEAQAFYAGLSLGNQFRK